MIQVCLIPLTDLPQATWDAAWAGAIESGRIWDDCKAMFQRAMTERKRWPTWAQLRAATKGKYALHSQTVQAVAKCVQTTFANTRLLRRTHPEMRMRYPYHSKHHYALLWPAQAVEAKDGRVILPMGRGQASLVLPLGRDLPFAIGACKLVWKDGWELQVTSRMTVPDIPAASPGPEQATGDLGEIHQIAVTTSTGQAVVMSGRGIRSIKRRRCMELGKLAAKRSKCKRGSRRDKRLARARRTLSRRTRYQIRDQRHKGLKAVVDFCVQEKVGELFVGNPDGVRRRKSGAVHNGRMARWEYGLDLNLLQHKCGKVGIKFVTGSERGTSSRCPVCETAPAAQGPQLPMPEGHLWGPTPPGLGRKPQHASAGLRPPGRRASQTKVSATGRGCKASHRRP